MNTTLKIISLLISQYVVFVSSYFLGLGIITDDINGLKVLLMAVLGAVVIVPVLSIIGYTAVKGRTPPKQRFFKIYFIATLIFVLTGLVLLALFAPAPTGA